jgi:serine/threonine protein kinase
VIDHLRDRLVAAVGDHYLIEAELGRGGMAAVFQALDIRLNRRVAIKVLPPDLAFNPAVRSRFLREAQMAAGLSHPNIVPIYMVDEVEGVVFFVMALVDGESVSARLKREGSFPIEEARTIVSQVADALDCAHRQGLVHRDIKPDNILLDRATRRPMVTDFGIARAAAEEQRLTVTGMAVGTPAYMSPEQAMGDRDVDGRSDIYSLGIVAYQMLAGETPFKATNTPAMLMKHVSEPPPPLRGRRQDLPSSFASAVERALAKRPEDRFRTGAEMRDALTERNGGHSAADVHPAAPVVPRDLIPESRRFPPGYPRPLAPLPAEAPPPPIAPPVGMTRRERRDWYNEQRDAYRDAVRLSNQSPEGRIAGKISRFRKSLFLFGALALMLFIINAANGGFPWFIFPVLGFVVALAGQLGSLWGDGVPFRDVLFGPVRKPVPAPLPELRSGPTVDPVSQLAARDVLEGMHGAPIRRAAESRRIIEDLLKRTTKKEREMLPADLEATVNALVDRVASVAVTLHRLDSDANGTSLGSLDKRIEALKLEMETPERDRRLSLLDRQRSTLRDLMERRSALLSQLESASLALENLKLDLVRFRSAGVSSALEDVTSATREARAVSRDIGHLLDAQDELKKL